MKPLHVLAWLFFWSTASAEEKTFGPVSLHEIVVDKDAGFRNATKLGEFPFDPKNEKSPRILVGGSGQLEFQSSRGNLKISLLNGYYVDSVLWISESRLLLTIWKENGSGSSANCLIEFAIDTDIIYNIRQVRFEKDGMVILRANGNNEKFVLADVRLGVNDFEYFRAFIDPSQLPLISKVKTDGPLRP